MMWTIANPIQSASVFCEEIEEMLMNPIKASDRNASFGYAWLVGSKHGQIASIANPPSKFTRAGKQHKILGAEGTVLPAILVINNLIESPVPVQKNRGAKICVFTHEAESPPSAMNFSKSDKPAHDPVS